MIRRLVLCLALLMAAAARSDDGPQAEGRAGGLLELGLTQYALSNGAPLAYRFGGGYEFPGGLRLTTALDTLYYVGQDGDKYYSYQFNNWLLQALYGYPLPWHLRAQAGANVDWLFGSRNEEATPVTAAGNPQGVDGFIGLGFLLGLAVDLTPHWQAALQGRWTETFSSQTPFSPFPAIDLTAVYTW